MSETTIELRQQNLDETDSMAQFESPDGEDVCASYVSRNVASELGEFASLTISDDADVTADRQKETTNYAVYETAGGAVTGLYVNSELLADDEGETPESIGLQFSESDEESFEEARAAIEEEAEEEAEGLLADSDESDDSDDEGDEVEISDEELSLTAE